MGISKNKGAVSPQIHYKPSILGYPFFWKHPYHESMVAHHDDMEFLMPGGWCFREMNGISSMSLVTMMLSKEETDWCVAKYHFPYPFCARAHIGNGCWVLSRNLPIFEWLIVILFSSFRSHLGGYTVYLALCWAQKLPFEFGLKFWGVPLQHRSGCLRCWKREWFQILPPRRLTWQ